MGTIAKLTESAMSNANARRPSIHGVFTMLALSAILAGCGNSSGGNESTKINGSIHVAAGKTASAVTTVNGSIHVDDNGAVTSAATVNGSIHLGDRATAGSLTSVNGAIDIGKGARVTGSASSVNGELTLKDDAEVAGSLANVNGRIALAAAHVGGGIKTVNGSMELAGASHVEGGILVQKPSGQLLQTLHNVPRIVIGPGTVVQGDLRFERTVTLYVSDKATIGAVTGATPLPFSGDTAPE